MKLLVLYKPRSEHATMVEAYVRDLRRQHDAADNKVELIDADTRDGAATATLYDIWSFPAMVATADDGAALNVWASQQLPLMDEVAGYMRA